MNPLIVVDPNIPFAKETFSPLGEVRLEEGRHINRTTVADADLLIVRSVTQVNADLLEGSRVRFVGTATIGTDHIGTEYLSKKGIAFADAAGSNANSVAEYLTAALLQLEEMLGASFDGRTIGVGGVGNVGRLVAEKAKILGMQVLLNDPPRAEKEGRAPFVSLQEVFEQAEVITLHTPLTREGNYPTYHLIGESDLDSMGKDAVLINTARGAVVDNQALLKSLEAGRIKAAVLDVWENEPEPDVQLLEKTTLATPHIAGYSLEGKVAGTQMIYDAACRHAGVEPHGRVNRFVEPLQNNVIEVTGQGREAIREAVNAAYNISEDDKNMRSILRLPPNERRSRFDQLRNEYRERREFASYTVTGSGLDSDTKGLIQDLGFSVV